MKTTAEIPIEDFIADPGGAFVKATTEHRLTKEEFLAAPTAAFEKAKSAVVVITDVIDGVTRAYVLRLASERLAAPEKE